MVTFAVILLVLGLTVRFIHVLSGAHIEKPLVYVVLGVVAAVPYLIIWFIFLGKNWARWLFLVVFGLALCSLSVRFQELLSLPAEEIGAYCAQLFLYTTAACALLSTTSGEWFRRNKE